MEKSPYLTRLDYTILSCLTLLFTILVFFKLGNHSAPETTYSMAPPNTDIILDLGEDTYVQQISIFLGHLNTRHLSISAYNAEMGEWEIINGDAVAESVFSWNNIDIYYPLRYLGLVSTDDEAYFNELIIINSNGKTIRPTNFREYPQLFDEQSAYHPVASYLTGTMFDEVYHGRTAFEFIHGYTTYETTHPPLGKSIISLGIRAFGMNPYGWRFMSAIFGILMLPLFYVFSKRLFQNSFISFSCTFLLVSDCMYYALSRIATIDIFAAFFIILMYFFLYEYLRKDTALYHELGKERPLSFPILLPLGLCGISMGLGIATKWTGVYAAAGLAILFFLHFFIYPTKKAAKLILFCCLFFLLIPAGIYVLSYLPFVGYTQDAGLIQKTVENIRHIFHYHSTLEADHYYSSPFYEWPVIWMPLLYSTTGINDTHVSAVNCMGNPAIWWTGCLCVVYLFCTALGKRDKIAVFLCIAYLAQYVPWMTIGRITFIYHYFPSFLFVVLMIGYTLRDLQERFSFGRKLDILYLVIAASVFFLFFPVISGYPVSKEWAQHLRLLKEWILFL